MNLKQLEYFLKVAETGSFSHASKDLFLAQPSLSQSIRNLEDELGVVLFDRGSRRTVLTPQGREFLSTARSILDAKNNYVRRITDFSGEVCGTITIGVPITRGSIILPKILPVFMQSYPNVRIQLEEDIAVRLEEKAASGEIDLCIISEPVLSRQLEKIVICKERILLITSRGLPVNGAPAYYRGSNDLFKTVRLKDFAGQNFIMINHQRKMYGVCQEILKAANVAPNVLFECNDCNTIIRLVAENLGVALMLDNAVKDLDEANRISAYYMEEWQHTWPLNICYRRSYAMTSALRAFIETVKDVYQEGAG